MDRNVYNMMIKTSKLMYIFLFDQRQEVIKINTISHLIKYSDLLVYNSKSINKSLSLLSNVYFFRNLQLSYPDITELYLPMARPVLARHGLCKGPIITIPSIKDSFQEQQTDCLSRFAKATRTQNLSYDVLMQKFTTKNSSICLIVIYPS